MPRLEDMLLESGKVSRDDLRRIQLVQQERGETLERLLVELGFMSEDDLLPVLAEYYQAPPHECAGLPAAAARLVRDKHRFVCAKRGSVPWRSRMVA